MHVIKRLGEKMGTPKVKKWHHAVDYWLVECCDHTYTESKECGICGADLRALWRTKEFLNNMGDV